MKKLIVALLIGLIAIVLVVGILQYNGLMADRSRSQMTAIHSIADKKFITRGPISIRSNADFNTTNGVTEGDGTLQSPYVIANFAIQNPAPRAITIQGTDAYLILKNIKIQAEPNETRPSNGIVIHNSKNIRLENITITGTSAWAIKISSGMNITLNKSKILNADSGVLVRGGINITISDNEVAYIQNRGINLDSKLQDITIINNNVHHSATPSVGGEGIEVWGQKGDKNIVIRANRVHHIGEDGIELVGVSNSKVYDNVSYNNAGQGIDIYGGSNNNILFNNVVFGNRKSGILITDSNGNKLIDNKIYQNVPNGVYFEKRHSNDGSRDNVLFGDSPWGNGVNVVADIKENTIVHAGKYFAKLPIDGRGQMFWIASDKLAKVRYFFRKWWLQVEAETETGNIYQSRKRIPPNIQFDLIPESGYLDYELIAFKTVPEPGNPMLDIILKTPDDKAVTTQIIIPLPSENSVKYQLLINGVKVEQKTAENAKLSFDISVKTIATQIQILPTK